MTKYLKKEQIIDIQNEEYKNAFNKLKMLIASDPILTRPDFNKKFTLTTDASNYALGAVLAQENKPICFASRTLNEHEVNYSAIEKELLAIVWSTKYFRPYLYGRRFTVQTDHKPSVWLESLKEPNMKLQRWKLKLNEYDFEIKHIQGKENHIADALSRIKINETFIGDTQYEDNDSEADTTLATIHSASEDGSQYIQITERPINHFNRQIIMIKGTQFKVTTKKYFNKNITKIEYIPPLKEIDVKDMLENIVGTINTTIFCTDDQDFALIQRTYMTFLNPRTRGKLTKSTELKENITNYADFKEIILKLHEDKLHQGIEKVVNEFKASNLYFPDYHNLIQNIINKCEICKLAKAEHRFSKLPMEITPKIDKIREKYMIDYYMNNRRNYLTCIDVYSKFMMAVETEARAWLNVKGALLTIFNTMGKPKLIKSDRDTGMNSLSLRNWLESENVAIEYNTSKTGVADIERIHKTINEKMRVILTTKNIEHTGTEMQEIAYTYNHKIIHGTTGRTPADIFLYNKQPIKNMQEIKKNRIDKINENRKEHEIDPQISKNLQKTKKSHNPFRKNINVTQIDNNRYEIQNRGHKTVHYKTAFQKKKKINKSKYSREPDESVPDNDDDDNNPVGNTINREPDNTDNGDQNK